MPYKSRWRVDVPDTHLASIPGSGASGLQLDYESRVCVRATAC